MFEIARLEKTLLKTRKNFVDVCRELDIEGVDLDLLTIGQC